MIPNNADQQNAAQKANRPPVTPAKATVRRVVAWGVEPPAAVAPLVRGIKRLIPLRLKVAAKRAVGVDRTPKTPPPAVTTAQKPGELAALTASVGTLQTQVNRLSTQMANLSKQQAALSGLVTQTANSAALTRQQGSELLNTQLGQRLLVAHYRQLMAQNLPLPGLQNAGFRSYSQTDEDGLLLYIFTLIGATNKTCVEVAFGGPNGANTTNLMLNWAWHGLLIEGKEQNVTLSRRFFETHKDTFLYPPTLVHAWVTAENINILLADNGVQGEVDLFSLDMDGVDYWVWKNLDAIRPRVVVVEYNNYFDPTRAVTVPYRPDFMVEEGSLCLGASLAAFVKLGREKGYRLVGCNHLAYNAFFVRNGIGEDVLPAIDPEACTMHPLVAREMRQSVPGEPPGEWIEV